MHGNRFVRAGELVKQDSPVVINGCDHERTRTNEREIPRDSWYGVLIFIGILVHVYMYEKVETV